MGPECDACKDRNERPGGKMLESGCTWDKGKAAESKTRHSRETVYGPSRSKQKENCSDYNPNFVPGLHTSDTRQNIQSSSFRPRIILQRRQVAVAANDGDADSNPSSPSEDLGDIPYLPEERRPTINKLQSTPTLVRDNSLFPKATLQSKQPYQYIGAQSTTNIVLPPIPQPAFTPAEAQLNKMRDEQDRFLRNVLQENCALQARNGHLTQENEALKAEVEQQKRDVTVSEWEKNVQTLRGELRAKEDLIQQMFSVQEAFQRDFIKLSKHRDCGPPSFGVGLIVVGGRAPNA